MGYIWLFLNKLWLVPLKNPATVCVVKNVTDLPCPSCGTTRAVSVLFDGHIINSLQLNPLGVIAALAMLIFPIWIFFDLITRSDSFYQVYHHTEKKMANKYVMALIAMLLAANWAWNIKKGF